VDSIKRLQRGAEWAATLLVVLLPLAVLWLGPRVMSKGLIPVPWDKLAHVLTYALLSPQVSRWVDHRGQGRVLPWATAASAAGLRLALDAEGHEAVVVEASWHGTGDVALPLGGPFHARRLTLRSSQVGDLPPHRKPRWDYTRRLTLALRLLRDAPALDALLTHDIPFDDAPARLPALLAPGAEALCPVITYP
jgi:hypothetical protein